MLQPGLRRTSRRAGSLGAARPVVHRRPAPVDLLVLALLGGGCSTPAGPGESGGGAAPADSDTGILSPDGADESGATDTGGGLDSGDAGLAVAHLGPSAPCPDYGGFGPKGRVRRYDIFDSTTYSFGFWGDKSVETLTHPGSRFVQTLTQEELHLPYHTGLVYFLTAIDTFRCDVSGVHRVASEQDWRWDGGDDVTKGSRVLRYSDPLLEVPRELSPGDTWTDTFAFTTVKSTFDDRLALTSSTQGVAVFTAAPQVQTWTVGAGTFDGVGISGEKQGEGQSYDQTYQVLNADVGSFCSSMWVLASVDD